MSKNLKFKSTVTYILNYFQDGGKSDFYRKYLLVTISFVILNVRRCIFLYILGSWLWIATSFGVQLKM